MVQKQFLLLPWSEGEDVFSKRSRARYASASWKLPHLKQLLRFLAEETTQLTVNI